MAGVKWSTEELKILTDNYEDKGGQYCVDLLASRTLSSVGIKACRMGLKINKPCSSRARTTEEYNVEIYKSTCQAIEPYVNNHHPIMHTCIMGHTWKTAPEVLLRGSGCPSCAFYGFDPISPATLYFVSFADNMYKLGVTKHKDIYKRYPGEWRSLKMKVEWSINFSTGKEALELEKKLLSNIDKLNTGLLKRGNTETTRHYINKPAI